MYRALCALTSWPLGQTVYGIALEAGWLAGWRSVSGEVHQTTNAFLPLWPPFFFVCHSSCAVPKSPQYQKVKVHNRQTTGRHVRPADRPLSRMLSLWHVELRTAHKVARNATITVQNHQQHTNRAVHVYNARRPPAHAQRSL